MPEKFLRIKESYQKAGKPSKVAAKLAAMTYNSQRKPGEKPVSPNYHKSKTR